jgi:hypothetical protein
MQSPKGLLQLPRIGTLIDALVTFADRLHFYQRLEFLQGVIGPVRMHDPGQPEGGSMAFGARSLSRWSSMGSFIALFFAAVGCTEMVGITA